MSSEGIGEGVLDRLYGVLRSPVATLRAVARAQPVGWAFALYVGVSLLSWLLAAGGLDPAVLEEVGIPFAPTAFVITGTVLSVAGVFLYVLLANVVARLLGGGGSYWGLFAAMGFAKFPALFSLPAAVAGELLGVLGALLAGLASLVILVWVFVLDIVAIRESHAISTARSVGTYLLTLLVLAFVIALVMVVVGLGAIAVG